VLDFYWRPISSSSDSGSRETRASSIVGMKRPRPLQFSQEWTHWPLHMGHGADSPAAFMTTPLPRHRAHVIAPVPMQ